MLINFNLYCFMVQFFLFTYANLDIFLIKICINSHCSLNLILKLWNFFKINIWLTIFNLALLMGSLMPAFLKAWILRSQVYWCNSLQVMIVHLYVQSTQVHPKVLLLLKDVIKVLLLVPAMKRSLIKVI